jgi:hypothetical protein
VIMLRALYQVNVDLSTHGIDCDFLSQ